MKQNELRELIPSMKDKFGEKKGERYYCAPFFSICRFEITFQLTHEKGEKQSINFLNQIYCIQDCFHYDFSDRFQGSRFPIGVRIHE